MIKAVIKLLLIIPWLALCVPPLWLANRFHKITLRNRIYSLGCAGLSAIVGLRIHVVGDVSEARPLMVVSNHISYLDIFVLGAKTPVRFTPKSDMASWPVISLICRAGGCIFVERAAGKINDTSKTIKEALANDQVVCLFPEATTGNGRHLLPFKSSFFNIAENKIGERELIIQPAAISYTHIGRLPIDSTQWPLIAWYGDMTLVPHLWKVLTLGRIEVTLTLLPPVTLREYGDRKKLAVYCQEIIEECLQRTKRAVS